MYGPLPLLNVQILNTSLLTASLTFQYDLLSPSSEQTTLTKASKN